MTPKGPIGFHNNKQNCYLNALLQSFISCNSLNNIKHKSYLNITKCLEHINNNDCKCNAINFFKYQSLEFNKEIGNINGAQDCHEIFLYIIKKIPEFGEYFSIKTSTTVKCKECKYKIVKGEDQYNIFLDTQYSYDLPGYVCDNCKSQSTCSINFNIDEVNKCFVICMTQTYNNRVQTYKTKLDIDGAIYKLKSEIMFNKGHYTANCLRNDKVYNINDLKVTPSKFGNGGIPLMLFYEYE